MGTDAACVCHNQQPKSWHHPAGKKKVKRKKDGKKGFTHPKVLDKGTSETPSVASQLQLAIQVSRQHRLVYFVTRMG